MDAVIDGGFVPEGVVTTTIVALVPTVSASGIIPTVSVDALVPELTVTGAG
jgi:hypothetical protein